MGCLKLTYRSEMPTLKVAWNSLYINQKGCAGNYRFGFQGMEADDEISGVGNTYTTFFRELDTRIVRWWSVDPMYQQTSYQSPYVAFDNNPIFFADPFGDKVKTTVTEEAKENETFDDSGVPEKVQKTFNEEWGMKVKYEKGDDGVGYLVYAGDIEGWEDVNISADAREMMMSELSPDCISDEVSLVFDYHKKEAFYTNYPSGEIYLNLNAINTDLSLKPIDNSKLNTPEAKRSMNFGRVFEHEFLHARGDIHDFTGDLENITYRGIKNQFKTQPGPVVAGVNHFRRQMGLENYQRLIYKSGKFTVLGNPDDESTQFMVNMKIKFWR